MSHAEEEVRDVWTVLVERKTFDRAAGLDVLAAVLPKRAFLTGARLRRLGDQ